MEPVWSVSRNRATMAQDPTTTKYIIKASFNAEGVVEKSDIVGAVFGQTEGLLGTEMDLRDLQKSARIGRLEVDLDQKSGKTSGSMTLPSALDKVESAIIAAGLETIDRIGPAKATVTVDSIDDARGTARQRVAERAKELLALINEDPSQDTDAITDNVRSAVQVAAATHFPGTKLTCGPNVQTADSIIVVEGRNDVINLLKCGIKNAIAVEGTSVPDAIQDLSQEKTLTLFVDGDRGGELIAREMLETCEVDFIARAPDTREVEELPHKLVMKCLKNKMSADQFASQHNIKLTRGGRKGGAKKGGRPKPQEASKQQPEASGKGGRGRGGPQKDQDGGKDDKPAGGRGRGRGRGSDKEEAKETSDRSSGRGRGGRGRGDKQDDGDRGAKKSAPKKAVHDARAGFREALAGLSGSLKAVVLDAKGKEIKKDLPVRELADALKSAKKSVHAVVFDGVITQRLLDIAKEKNVATVVGVKMGNVSKVPDDVEILTRDDLN